MTATPQPILQPKLGALNRAEVADPVEVLAVLRRARKLGVRFRCGFTRSAQEEVGVLEYVDAARVRIRVDAFERRSRRQVFFRFHMDGQDLFFAAGESLRVAGHVLEFPLPLSLWTAERRDLTRGGDSVACPFGREVLISGLGEESRHARVLDWSPQGLGVEVPNAKGARVGRDLELGFVEGPRAGAGAHAKVRHSTVSNGGWLRLGLSVSDVRDGASISVEPCALPRSQPAQLAGIARLASRRLSRGRLPTSARGVPIYDFYDRKGHRLRAIVESSGNPRGATAIVIPPAWGKTKETLQPLAATILATFEHAGLPVSVLRFDGVNRRGESHKDEGCWERGREHLRFKFSQAVDDIRAALDFLENSEEFATTDVTLVSFSAASVEARRAVSEEPARVRNWVSVVGMPDLQSTLRATSGGLDYAYGVARGIQFGLQEVLGVLVDIDHMSPDALEHSLIFLEDARRDMASIRVPVTWFHGRHDGWMDLERVRELMSCGPQTDRRLLEIPAGHQLRSSREALRVFRLVAAEVVRLATGKRVPGRTPDLVRLEESREAERARLPSPKLAPSEFWRNYLLGRDGRVGIDIVAATDAYSDFVKSQVSLLELSKGDRVVDLGAGTGTALAHICDASEDGIAHEVDLVPDAIKRALGRNQPQLARLRGVAADFDGSDDGALPYRDAVFDAALSSLVICYLDDPIAFLRDARRVLKPGGRMVVSSLRPDADLSKIFTDALREIPPRRARELFGEDAAQDLFDLGRSFLSDGARLFELEELGRFRFLDAEELAEGLRVAGFRDVRTQLSFGDPAQAVVATGRR